MTNNTKPYLNGAEMRTEMAAGIEEAATLVGATAGPGGHLVMLCNQMVPYSTKDGHSVLENMDSDNVWHKQAFALLLDGTKRIVASAGDGTTSTTLITNAMIKYGMGLLESGMSHLDVMAKITDQVDVLTSNIRENSQQVEALSDLQQLCITSANGDEEMANKVATTVFAGGAYIRPTIKKGTGVTDTITTTKGFSIGRGLAHSAFVTDNAVNNVTKPVIITAARELVADDIRPFADTIQRECAHANRQLVIAALDYTDEFLSGLAKMGNKGSIFPVRVDAAGRAQMHRLMDLMVYLAGDDDDTYDMEDKVITVYPNRTSRYVDVVSTPSSMTFTENMPSTEVAEHVARLVKEVEESITGLNIDMTRDRIANLTGSYTVFTIVGDTDAEQEERRARYEDTVLAAMAAMREGYSAGGGYAYFHPEAPWSTAVLEQIMRNSGAYEDVILEAIKDHHADGVYYSATGDEQDSFPFAYDATLTQVMVLRTALSITRMVIRGGGATRSNLFSQGMRSSF